MKAALLKVQQAKGHVSKTDARALSFKVRGVTTHVQLKSGWCLPWKVGCMCWAEEPTSAVSLVVCCTGGFCMVSRLRQACSLCCVVRYIRSGWSSCVATDQASAVVRCAGGPGQAHKAPGLLWAAGLGEASGIGRCQGSHAPLRHSGCFICVLSHPQGHTAASRCATRHNRMLSYGAQACTRKI